MEMTGSETALEELMFRVLGNCIQDRIVAKLADDLYCGGNTLDEILRNWKRVLDALQKSNLKLSPSKTVICPRYLAGSLGGSGLKECYQPVHTESLY